MIKWLYPGMHVKRWLALIFVGITFVSLGFAYFYVEAYRSQPFPEVAYELTLQFLPRWIRGILFLGIGGGVVLFAVVQLNRSLLSAYVPANGNSVVDTVYYHRYLKRGPKVVVIGGGNGLSTALRGLKEHTGNLTAIVTVADSGGSSGRLRKELGLIPPGDFRQCLVALADAEPLMTRLFQYRFSAGDGLEGHSFGNLFIAAMTSIVGNFERALRESSRVLAVRGQILPSTLANLTLCADFYDQGPPVKGEAEITERRRPIKRVYLLPEHPVAYPEAIRAILQADLIVMGPGSLYTSVLPNLLVEDITRAIRSSAALKVYVCNVATQPGETDGYSVQAHLQAMAKHVGEGLFHAVLVNDDLESPIPPAALCEAVRADDGLADLQIPRVVFTNLVDPENPVRHHPKRLAEALMRVYEDRGRTLTAQERLIPA